MIIILLILIYILNLIDYGQTLYAIQHFGLSVEANPIARSFFEQNQAGTFKLIMVPIMLIFIGIAVKMEKRLSFAVYFLLIYFSILVLHNFIELAKMGILHF